MLSGVNPAGPAARAKSRRSKLVDRTRMRQLIQQTPEQLTTTIADSGYKNEIDMYAGRFHGAELIEVDEGDFEEAIRLKDDIVEQKGYFSLNQFDNPLNIECHYKTTFKELLNHSLTIGKYISAFISGTGTGGTIMGVQKGFSEFDTRVKMIAVEPAESPVMSGGEKGLHGIQGIGDGSQFLVDLEKIDEILTVSTEDAKERCKQLALDNGLLVGISAGANILAAERWVEENNPSGIVFTILCDRGERYCSMLY